MQKEFQDYSQGQTSHSGSDDSGEDDAEINFKAADLIVSYFSLFNSLQVLTGEQSAKVADPSWKGKVY
jgi:hypothetical protein